MGQVGGGEQVAGEEGAQREVLLEGGGRERGGEELLHLGGGEVGAQERE